jgi:hypothetical protein
MRVTFEEVGFKLKKTGKCPICDKRMVRTERFFQTLNPWNMLDGRPKTREEILEQERTKGAAWKNTPLQHEDCIESCAGGD